MALTNNEKQIRHKKLEELKKRGNEVLISWMFNTGGLFIRQQEKSNAEIKDEIEEIINLPSGWTDEDYNCALNKLNNYLAKTYDNPYLMQNDINAVIDLKLSENPKEEIAEAKKAIAKAPEVIRNLKSTLKLAELNKSNQIAVVAELMRQLAIDLLNEKKVPKTFANATAFSLIGRQYDKPEWTWKVLAQNLYHQNSKTFADKIVSELSNPGIEDKDIIWNY